MSPFPVSEPHNLRLHFAHPEDVRSDSCLKEMPPVLLLEAASVVYIDHFMRQLRKESWYEKSDIGLCVVQLPITFYIARHNLSIHSFKIVAPKILDVFIFHAFNIPYIQACIFLLTFPDTFSSLCNYWDFTRLLYEGQPLPGRRGKEEAREVLKRVKDPANGDREIRGRKCHCREQDPLWDTVPGRFTWCPHQGAHWKGDSFRGVGFEDDGVDKSGKEVKRGYQDETDMGNLSGGVNKEWGRSAWPRDFKKRHPVVSFRGFGRKSSHRLHLRIQ